MSSEHRFPLFSQDEVEYFKAERDLLHSEILMSTSAVEGLYDPPQSLLYALDELISLNLLINSITKQT